MSPCGQRIFQLFQKSPARALVKYATSAVAFGRAVYQPLTYNLWRFVEEEEKSTVIVVEGFFDAIKVHQAGYPCVALMGSSLSSAQEKLLCQNFTGVVLLFDGDEAGRKATDDCLGRLGRQMSVKAVLLEDGMQPD